MLDDTHWPATSALIDGACGIAGNALLVGEGLKTDNRVLFVGLYYRGQRRTNLESEYLDVYHPINEAIPRQLQLPASHLVHLKDLYTAEELKTSRAYNEAYSRAQAQNFPFCSLCETRLNCKRAGSGLTVTRWKFRTESRRPVCFDTSTKPDAPVSWGASEMGRGTAVSMIGAVAWCARFPARNGAEGEKIWIARKKA